MLSDRFEYGDWTLLCPVMLVPDLPFKDFSLLTSRPKGMCGPYHCRRRVSENHPNIQSESCQGASTFSVPSRPVLGNIRKFRVSYKNREILGKEFHRVKEEESHPDKDNHFVPKPRAIKKSSNNVP